MGGIVKSLARKVGKRVKKAVGTGKAITKKKAGLAKKVNSAEKKVVKKAVGKRKSALTQGERRESLLTSKKLEVAEKFKGK